jgi:hypothetical protein
LNGIREMQGMSDMSDSLSCSLLCGRRGGDG